MKITSYEYHSLMWFVMRASFIGISLNNIINISKQNSWLAGLLTLLLGLIPLGIFIYLQNYEKDKNISEKVLDLFKHTGYLINIILIIGSLLLALVTFSDLTYFVNSQFLYNTPHLIINICFIIPIFYALIKGFRSFSKTSLFIFIFVVVIIIFIILSVLNNIDIENLKPFFVTNQEDILHSSAILISYNVIPIFLLTIIPLNDVSNYKNKHTILFYFLSLISLINAIFLTITILGSDLSMLYQYPELNVLKIGNFIERAESILALEWIVALIILIIMSIYFACEIIKTTFKYKKTNKIIFFVCLLIFCLNEFTFVRNSEANNFYKNYMVIIMFFYLFLAFIIMIKALLKKHFLNQDSR